MDLSVSKIALVAALLSSVPVLSANAAQPAYDDAGGVYTQPVEYGVASDTGGVETQDIGRVNDDGYYVTNIVGEINGVTQGIPSIMRANVAAEEAAAAAKQLLASNPAVSNLVAELSKLPNGSAALVALAKDPQMGTDILSRFTQDNVSSIITGLARTPAAAVEGMALSGLENIYATLKTFDDAELANYLETHQLSGMTDNQFWSLYHENLDEGEESFTPDELSELFDESEDGGDDAGDDASDILGEGEDEGEYGEGDEEEVATGGIDNTDEDAYDEYSDSEDGVTGGSGGGSGSSGSGSGSGSSFGGGSSQGWKII
jgi:uncharacterized membrane protein YgcG